MSRVITVTIDDNDKEFSYTVRYRNLWAPTAVLQAIEAGADLKFLTVQEVEESMKAARKMYKSLIQEWMQR